MKKLFSVLSALALLGSPLASYAVTYSPIVTLAPTIDGNANLRDDYGQAIHFYGDYLFVSAPLAAPVNVLAAGAVYVYKKEHGVWSNTQIITTGGTNDQVGAVSIKTYKDYLLISLIGTPRGPIVNDVPTNQDFTGSIQIYRLDKKIEQWVFDQALDRTVPGLENLSVASPTFLANPTTTPPSSVELGAMFGLTFGFGPSGELLVGAATQANEDTFGNVYINSGCVFVMKHHHHTWVLDQILFNPDGLSANDTFGGYVAVSGDYAAISNSAIFTDARLNSNSSVYLFHRKHGEWEYVHKVQGDQVGTTPMVSTTFGGSMTPNVQMGDNFGATLAFSGKWLLVGAPLENLGTSTLKGAAYFFELTSGDNGSKQLVRRQKIVSDSASTVLMAFDVALSDKLALIGDPTHPGPTGAVAQGTVYAYHRNSDDTWVLETKLYDPAGSANQLFGGGVGIQGKYVAAGTATAYPLSYIDFYFTPTLLSPAVPVPTPPSKVVIWKRL